MLLALALVSAAFAEDPAAATADATPDAPPTATGTYEGTLLSGDAHSAKLTTTGGAVPPVGARGQLSKWVETQVFGANVTMWLGIADVTVTAVSASTITLSVQEVTFDMTVNEKKVDPFKAGMKTQLAWTK